MPRPDVSDLTEQLYEALGFHGSGDEQNGWTLLSFCAAWVETLIDPVYEIVAERDDQPGWAVLLDPEECPARALPHLAQYVGAVLTPEMDEAQQRAEIGEPTGWKRGQEASMRLTIQRTLTGTKRVVIRPRTPSLGHHYIRTLASETPSPERTATVTRDAVPAWEALDFETFDALTYADLDAGYADYAAVDAAFDSYAEIPESPLP